MTELKFAYHIPVMSREVSDYLQLSPGKTILDATVGTGGHSLSILKKILPGGRLVCIDQDEESLDVARARLEKFSQHCTFVRANFDRLDIVLLQLGVKKVNAMLFDLGMSSFQLSNPQRGLSFHNEGPLDMRLDKSLRISAYDLVNNLNEQEISDILWDYGQERWHNRIARFLVKEREKHPVSTTLELANLVARAIPARYRYRYHRIHPATRTFQALRIAVNRELSVLETALAKAVALLEEGGRICVISFHSLEDRIVKLALRKSAQEKEVRIITPKPLTPSAEEVAANNLSRSAKFRVAERI